MLVPVHRPSTDEADADWRQPAPGPAVEAVAPPKGVLRRRVGAYLADVFESAEDENKRVILDVLRAGPQRRRVLDLGCFNGAFTVDLARAARAEHMCGVEWLREHADAGAARGIEVSRVDLNGPLPYEDDSFDLVHANQIIEHLKSTDGFMRECKRVMAPGGIAIISTNNLAAWHNIASLVLGLQPLPNHVSDEVHVGNPLDPRRGLTHADRGQTHLRIFTTRALCELAELHGLRVRETRMNGFYPFRPALARRVVRLDPTHAAFMVVVLEHA